MEKKIVLSLFYMGIITAIAGILITTVIYYDFFSREVEENLIHECRLVAQSYEKLDSPFELEKYTGENFRITLIDTNGSVVYESDADSQKMANHMDRAEIRSAVATGTGSDTRLSDTLGTEDHYYAVRLDDGSILRVSVRTDSIIALFERSLLIILIIIAGIVIISLIVSVKLTDKLIAPLRSIPGILEKKKTIDEASVYPEIVPLIKEIESVRSVQNEMRQEFTANVSHELKTPLTSISGYAELIETGMAQDEDIIKFAGKIRKESSRLLTLIGDILKLSELDTAENYSFDDIIDLTAAAEECREQLANIAAQRGIEISVSGSGESIRGNSTEIHELIYNLMDNAIKYNRDNGNIDVNISGKTLSVNDTGIGIPNESIPRIFERFYRTDKSRSRAKGGTGLGLSIVRHIADRHGAEIEVESTVNVGTSISVTFR